jgi:N-methylhydantoinase A/oxoprolinase/acetone carboxylase beta subunit
VIIPPNPGLCSAFGAAIAPLRVDRVWSLGRRSDDLDEGSLRERFTHYENEARAELRADGLRDEPSIQRAVACRYHQQNYEQDVPVPDLGPGFSTHAAARFHELHRAFYGYAFESDSVEFVHCKLTLSGQQAKPTAEDGPVETALDRGARAVTAPDGRLLQTPIIRRGLLQEPREGPLVIEEEDSTVYLPAGWIARNGAAGSLLLEHAERTT